MSENNEKVHFLRPKQQQFASEPLVGSELETLRHFQMRGVLSDKDFKRLQMLEAQAKQKK